MYFTETDTYNICLQYSMSVCLQKGAQKHCRLVPVQKVTTSNRVTWALSQKVSVF